MHSGGGLGLIPTKLFNTFLSPILPAPEAAKVLDWAVFNGERFAGLYFFVTLLTLHASKLVEMSGAQFKQWLSDLLVPGAEWYRAVEVSPSQAPLSGQEASPPAPPVSCSAAGVSWSVFTRAWMAATAVVVGSTPKPFRDSLARVETWAVLQTERQRAALSKQLLTMSAGNIDVDDDDVFGDSSGAGEDVDHKDDDEKSESSTSSSPSANDDSRPTAGNEVNLLSMVKAIGKE